MSQSLRSFSNDEVRRVFARASSAAEAQVGSALEELERQITQWTTSTGNLGNAIAESAATTERNVAGGFDTDIDRLIEDFQRYEMEENASRANIERTSFTGISNPDLLSAVNRALGIYLDLSRFNSQAYHDARWRLMEARARFMTSAPTGPVHGEITDLDALIKS
jgi:hypothetical protein